MLESGSTRTQAGTRTGSRRVRGGDDSLTTGCYHAKLKAPAVAKCLTTPTAMTPGSHRPEDRRALFVGDSNVRRLYFAFARAVDSKKGGKMQFDTAWEDQGDKHTDRTAVVHAPDGHKLTLEFWWDPYLNTTQTADYLTSAPKPASLLVLGSGLWYLRQPASGGLGAWTTAVQSTFDKLREWQGTPAAPLLTPWDSMATDPEAWNGWLPAKKQTEGKHGFVLADAVIVLPVPIPVEDKLDAERKATIGHSDVEAMNADLTARLDHKNPAPVIIPTVFNELLVDSETNDGLHWSDRIMDKQAELLLGWRCNDVLRKEAQEGTCCRRYAKVRPLQGLLLLYLGLWAPLSYFFAARLSPGHALSPFILSGKAASAVSTFGLAMAYLFIADRTTVFTKENKAYDARIFGGLTLAALVVGLLTVKNKGKDLGFLNRDITDEWKGWMQSE